MEKNKTISKTFLWLFIGLLICFGTSYSIANNEMIANVFSGSFGLIGCIVLFILQIAISILIPVKLTTMEPVTMKILYLLYCLIVGITFSGIFSVFKLGSLAIMFLITAILFLIFAVIGRTTKVDFNKFYPYVVVALIVLLIVEIINIFLLNNTINIITCIVGVLLFTFFVAYDIRMVTNDNILPDCENKSIYFAFTLFLDFINLFRDLLYLFGETRDD